MNTEQNSAGLTLKAATAAELMTENPVSIRADALVSDAVKLLAAKGISAAPVIDETGRPVGVVSQSDIVTHEGAKQAVPHHFYAESAPGSSAARQGRSPQADSARVRDIMTPAIFSVVPHAPARKVVEEMVALRVHRLFVVDPSGVLVGIISAFDILRRLV
jgi:CBS domain-containing protein